MFNKIKKRMSKKRDAKPEELLENQTTVEATQEQQTDDATANAEEKQAESDPTALLKQEIEELKAHISELKDKNLRQQAEFQNFRRRSNQEKLQLISSAAKDTLSALLPVLDDFDRAKRNADDDNSSEAFTEGVTLVYNKLKGVTKALGLEVMDATGEDFNPELHEALTEIPAPTDELKGKVVDTIEQGYKLNDKIIRHAKVVVGK